MIRFFTFILIALSGCVNICAQSLYTQLTDVPAMYIETVDGLDITDKENYVLSKVVYVNGNEVTIYNDTQIRGRGNSTWYAEKKPYRLKFAKKEVLLGEGFAKEKNWTLLANHGDKTMIRNALTYDLGKFLGFNFCPAAQFVDLYMNGNYRGTYQISDQVQVKPKRVNVDEVAGWLLELTDDIHKDNPYIVTERNFYVNIKNPKDERLTDIRQQEILDWCNLFSATIWSDDYCNPLTGYRTMIDETSFINWYIATELTGNVDGFSSVYVYKDSEEQIIHFGPLWDEDLGYNNSSERNWETCLLAYAYHDGRQLEQTIRRLWEDPWFAEAVNDRWKELVGLGIQQYLLNKIDSLYSVIYRTQQENFKIWPINQSVYGFERQRFHNTYDEYIIDLKSFINIHIPYITSKFKELLNTTTGVKTLKADENKLIEYDLSGQRIKYRRKGRIYISQGNKVIY